MKITLILAAFNLILVGVLLLQRRYISKQQSLINHYEAKQNPKAFKQLNNLIHNNKLMQADGLKTHNRVN
jgi:hypothetical protein